MQYVKSIPVGNVRISKDITWKQSYLIDESIALAWSLKDTTRSSNSEVVTLLTKEVVVTSCRIKFLEKKTLYLVESHVSEKKVGHLRDDRLWYQELAISRLHTHRTGYQEMTALGPVPAAVVANLGENRKFQNDPTRHSLGWHWHAPDSRTKRNGFIRIPAH